jgi:hypothetical protein
MAIAHRLRRLERDAGLACPDASGFRPCRSCRSGENRIVVFKSEVIDVGPPQDTICKSCGRDLGEVINIYAAEAPPGWKPSP